MISGFPNDPLGSPNGAASRKPERRRSGNRITVIWLHAFRKATLLSGSPLYTVPSPSPRGRGGVKALTVTSLRVLHCPLLVFLNSAHTYVNSPFIKFSSNYPAWVCYLFPARTPVHHSGRCSWSNHGKIVMARNKQVRQKQLWGYLALWLHIQQELSVVGSSLWCGPHPECPSAPSQKRQ